MGAARGRDPAPAGSAGADVSCRRCAAFAVLVRNLATGPGYAAGVIPAPGAPVDVLGLPGADRGGVPAGRRTRLRRRRGDGLDRRGQPGRRRAARPRRALRRAGAVGPRPPSKDAERCTPTKAWPIAKTNLSRALLAPLLLPAVPLTFAGNSIGRTRPGEPCNSMPFAV